MLYQRQEKLDIKVPKKLVTVGVGGAGSWATLFCALCGTAEITMIDPDTIEVSNLNRTPYAASDVGRLKVDALSDMIADRRGDTVLIPLADVFPSLVDIDINTVVIDATDDIDTQKEIFDYVNKRGARYIRIGYNGHMVSVSSDPTVVWSGEEDPDDDTYGTQSWVGSSALAGLLGLLYAAKMKDERYAKEVSEI